MKNDDLELAFLAIGQYRELWKVLEDLETLLWRIKEFNDDMEEMTLAEE